MFRVIGLPLSIAMIASVAAAPSRAETIAPMQDQQARTLERRIANLERRLAAAEARRTPPATGTEQVAKLEARVNTLAKENAEVKARVQDHQRQLTGAAAGRVPTIEKQIDALTKQVVDLARQLAVVDRDAKLLRRHFETHSHRVPVALMPHKMLFANPSHASPTFVGTVAFGGPGVGSQSGRPDYPAQ